MRLWTFLSYAYGKRPEAWMVRSIRGIARRVKGGGRGGP